ncbi:hypothetical protein VNO77_27304 [Canavalia gladiata]|uniref:Uncharacterized protein n=1 Tax=Canavalia gladiata TaxID=3824 RepID=A0AAN9Q6Z4_CANGL
MVILAPILGSRLLEYAKPSKKDLCDLGEFGSSQFRTTWKASHKVYVRFHANSGADMIALENQSHTQHAYLEMTPYSTYVQPRKVETAPMIECAVTGIGEGPLRTQVARITKITRKCTWSLRGRRLGLHHSQEALRPSCCMHVVTGTRAILAIAI